MCACMQYMRAHTGARVHTHIYTRTLARERIVHIYVRCMFVILNKVPRKVPYLGTRYYY